MALAKCIECKKQVKIVPARLKTFKFCSYSCRGKWRAKHWAGANHPQYQSGPRVKDCERCGKAFRQRETEAISEFRKRRFCSMECTKHGQRRLYGKDHPLFKPNARRRVHDQGKQGAWARAVIERDRATCQKCGANDTELHAHHILPVSTHPEKAWDLSNGLTLCWRCHLLEHHPASTANGVNSGNIPPGNAEDNPEPSNGRKFVEGVTTRGRAYRRWVGECEQCGAFISRAWSDVVGKAHIFCSKPCAGKYRQRHHPHILRSRR